MISAIVCLNTLLNTEGRPINMDNRDNNSPNTSIEQQQDTGKTSSGLQQETQSAPEPEAQSAPEPETQSDSKPEPQPEAQNVKKTYTPQKSAKKFEPAHSGTGSKAHPKKVLDEQPPKSTAGKWAARIIIGAVVAVGAYFGYEVYIRPAQKGNISSNPATVSPEVTRPNYPKLAEEIFASLERSFGEFVNAGAVEDYVFCETENDLLQKWRGRNIFMFTGSRAGFIDTDKFSWAVSDSLQPSTLEISDDGTVFQADMSNAQSFSANSLIESAVTPANSLKPERFTDTNSMKRNITAYITRRLEANGTNGYIRFVLRTNIEGAKFMTAYSLNPSDASEKTYLVLSDNFMGFDGRILREIEDSVNVMSDINAVSFTLRKGRVESYESLTECLRKFVKSFAK